MTTCLLEGAVETLHARAADVFALAHTHLGQPARIASLSARPNGWKGAGGHVFMAESEIVEGGGLVSSEIEERSGQGGWIDHTVAAVQRHSADPASHHRFGFYAGWMRTGTWVEATDPCGTEAFGQRSGVLSGALPESLAPRYAFALTGDAALTPQPPADTDALDRAAQLLARTRLPPRGLAVAHLGPTPAPRSAHETVECLAAAAEAFSSFEDQSPRALLAALEAAWPGTRDEAVFVLAHKKAVAAFRTDLGGLCIPRLLLAVPRRTP